jgi:TonB family protein
MRSITAVLGALGAVLVVGSLAAPVSADDCARCTTECLHRSGADAAACARVCEAACARPRQTGTARPERGSAAASQRPSEAAPREDAHQGLRNVLPGENGAADGGAPTRGPVTGRPRANAAGGYETPPRGRLELGRGGAVRGKGRLDPARVVRVIRQRAFALRAFYEHALRDDPQLAGTVTVAFTVEPTGRVSNAHAAADTLGSPAVTARVVETVAGFRWNPGPVGGSVDFSYPFIFRPIADVTTQTPPAPLRGTARIDGGAIRGGSGQLVPSSIANTLRSRLGLLRACYERGLRRHPRLAGTMTVAFTIQPEGTVSAVRVSENTTGDRSVAACVTGVMRGFRLRPGPVGGSVDYAFPVSFAPAAE